MEETPGKEKSPNQAQFYMHVSGRPPDDSKIKRLRQKNRLDKLKA
jgi:hypothetical protein